MPAKQRPPRGPPTASSSESEEEDEEPQRSFQKHAEEVSSEEEVSSSSEEHKDPPPPSSVLLPSVSPNSQPKPKPKPKSKSKSKHPSSESDSESDTDSEPTKQKTKPTDPTLMPYPKSAPSSVPPSVSPSSQPKPKPKPKPSSSESESDTNSEPTKLNTKPTVPAHKPSPKSAPKRTAQSNTHATDPKRAKRKSSADASSSSSEEAAKKRGGERVQTKLFQRVWSEEDVVAILKGMAEFTSRTGQDPHKYADTFLNFVKKSLKLEASSTQLRQKIRRLKKKFETHVKRGEKVKFAKPHDHEVFELSKKVWGEGANGLVEKPKTNVKPATTPTQEAPSIVSKEAAKTPVKVTTKRNVGKSEAEKSQPELAMEEVGELVSGDVSLLYREISDLKGLDEDEVKRGLALIGESQRKELAGRWKKLRLAEIELVANRSLLRGEQIKLIFEALQSSNH